MGQNFNVSVAFWEHASQKTWSHESAYLTWSLPAQMGHSLNPAGMAATWAATSSVSTGRSSLHLEQEVLDPNTRKPQPEHGQSFGLGGEGVALYERAVEGVIPHLQRDFEANRVNLHLGQYQSPSRLKEDIMAGDGGITESGRCLTVLRNCLAIFL